MTAGKWCYHPWTGNPVDHDFNTKKWCVTVTLQNIKKKYLQSSKHMGLSKTGPPRNWVGYHRVPHWNEHFWATLISGKTYISIYLHYSWKNTYVWHTTWEKHMTPCIPFGSKQGLQFQRSQFNPHWDSFFRSRRPSLSGIWLPLSHGSPLATRNPLTFGRSLFGSATNLVRIDHGSKPAIDTIHFEMF